MNNLVPIVLEHTSKGERSYDIYSRLLRDRILMLDGEINNHSASLVVAQLLFLEADDPKKSVSFYINSPGGHVTAGLSIYDTMAFISCPVQTIVLGQAASMASLLASAGTPGQRFILPNARHMVHSVSGGSQGTVWDATIQMEEMIRLNSRLTEIYAKHTGRSIEELKQAMSRDHYLDADASVAFGLADQVISHR